MHYSISLPSLFILSIALGSVFTSALPASLSDCNGILQSSNESMVQGNLNNTFADKVATGIDVVKGLYAHEQQIPQLWRVQSQIPHRPLMPSMLDLPTIFTLRFGWTDRTEDLVLQTTAYPPYKWEPPQIVPPGEGPRKPPLHWTHVQHQLSIEQAMALVRRIPLFGSVRFRSVVITHYKLWAPQAYYCLFPISGEHKVIFVGIEDKLVHWL